ncbi:hypothetical protein QYF36_019281 [Acer negundo]|nr:hypothetical protein QYF36_019281 [Acer negundo]
MTTMRVLSWHITVTGLWESGVFLSFFSDVGQMLLLLLAGSIAIKTLIITTLGPRLGLTLQESVIIGFLLSQGGEFAFVAFSLANGLGVLPLELNKLLIIVVVLSMVLTPHCLTKLEDGPPILPMTSLMQRINSICNEHNLNISVSQKTEEMVSFEGSEPVAILEFGQMVQGPANFSSTPLASGGDGSFMGWPYVAFDLNPSVVKVSKSCTPASF